MAIIFAHRLHTPKTGKCISPVYFHLNKSCLDLHFSVLKNFGSNTHKSLSLNRSKYNKKVLY